MKTAAPLQASPQAKTPQPCRYAITQQQRARVQALTGISEKSIKKWERGEKVIPSIQFALRKAFRQLSLPMPKAAPVATIRGAQ